MASRRSPGSASAAMRCGCGSSARWSGGNLHRRHGARDAASWLADLAGDRKGATAQGRGVARELDSAPVVADAVAAGALSKAKAAELVRGKNLPEDVQVTLVDDAVVMPVEQVAAT